MRVSMRDLAWMIDRLPNPNYYEPPTFRQYIPKGLEPARTMPPKEVPQRQTTETVLFYKRHMEKGTCKWQEWELEIA